MGTFMVSKCIWGGAEWMQRHFGLQTNYCKIISVGGFLGDLFDLGETISLREIFEEFLTSTEPDRIDC